MKKYTLRYLTAIALTLMLSSNFTQTFGGESPSSEDIKKRDKNEKNIAPFDANYFKADKLQHIAVLFDIVDGKVVLSDKPAIVGAGQGPHRPSSGNFVVVSKSREGKIIEKYFIEDPTVARSLEGKENNLSRIENMNDIPITIPLDADIAIIEMGPVQKEMISYDVGKFVKEAVAKAQRLRKKDH